MSGVHSLLPGDQVRTYKGLVLRHPVIYLGNEQFIEKSKTGQVRLRLASTFADQNFFVERRPRPEKARIVAQRALARLGQERYDPISANCQHFVNEVYSGQSISEQVEGLKAFAVIGSVFLILGVLAGG